MTNIPAAPHNYRCMRFVLLLLLLLITITMAEPQRKEKNDNTVVELARIARDAANEQARRQYWAETDRRQTEERLALAEIKERERTSAAQLTENAFQFKVRVLMQDGMSGTEAMIMAKGMIEREEALKMEEDALKESRRAFESEKYWNGAWYFAGGSLAATCLAVIVAGAKQS